MGMERSQEWRGKDRGRMERNNGTLLRTETRVGKVDIILRVGKDPLKQFIYLFI